MGLGGLGPGAAHAHVAFGAVLVRERRRPRERQPLPRQDRGYGLRRSPAARRPVIAWKRGCPVGRTWPELVAGVIPLPGPPAAASPQASRRARIPRHEDDDDPREEGSPRQRGRRGPSAVAGGRHPIPGFPPDPTAPLSLRPRGHARRSDAPRSIGSVAAAEAARRALLDHSRRRTRRRRRPRRARRPRRSGWPRSKAFALADWSFSTAPAPSRPRGGRGDAVGPGRGLHLLARGGVVVDHVLGELLHRVVRRLVERKLARIRSRHVRRGGDLGEGGRVGDRLGARERGGESRTAQSARVFVGMGHPP